MFNTLIFPYSTIIIMEAELSSDLYHVNMFLLMMGRKLWSPYCVILFLFIFEDSLLDYQQWNNHTPAPVEGSFLGWGLQSFKIYVAAEK